jgi:secreted PhoX family phosphatase
MPRLSLAVFREISSLPKYACNTDKRGCWPLSPLPEKTGQDMNIRPINTSIALALATAFALPSASMAVELTVGKGADKVTAIEFTPTPAPAGAAEMATAYTRSSAIVSYASGLRKVFPLSYHTLFRSGQRIGSGEAGLVVDVNGRPIDASVGDGQGNHARGPFHAYAPDANSLIRIREGKLEKLYLVTQYEYHTEAPLASGMGTMELYAQLPASMSLATLNQDHKSGKLKATQLSNIDMKSIGGLWIPCAASLTPWNTHLAGEEYEPNARQFEHEPLESMNLYLGTPGKVAADGGATPYRYGHLVEVKVGAGGTADVTKRYAMGRLATELADIMPDERTAYMGDDGRDTMLFMFVADKARDLSAGTLYAAKWEQRSADNGGSAGLKWLRLGHATEAKIKALVDRGIKFSDIFEVAAAAEVKAAPEKYTEFKPVFVYEGQGGKRAPGSGAKQEVTWLKLRPGMETAAAFLESRRYGAMLGATSEFTKMEGVTHNPDDRKLYIAMSYIEAAMLDGQNGDRPNDHIKLKGDAKDLVCGGIYQAHLSGAQKDQAGDPIRSEWVATTMDALLLGARKPFGQPQGAYDKCDTERIANPDNIKYSPEMRTLFIGEDSGNHLNNFLWALSLDSGQLTRLLSAPAGGEHTGLQVVPALGGHGYIMGNIQHPGAANDLKQYPDAIRVELRKRIDQRGGIGYLGGLPAINPPRR